MQYEDTPVSQNIEDRRGQGGGGMVGGGGLGLGAIIVIFAISYLTGISPSVLMSGAEMATRGGNPSYTQPASTGPAADPNDPMRKFLAHVLGGTEAVWTTVLPQQAGVQYQPATLVIYDGATRSGCGGARAAMGPFYCPIDKKVYLDTSFFRDMKTKYGGGGDFAYAYVVAHEIGHHVQDLLGILDKVDPPKSASARPRRTRYPSGSSCRPIAWPASGPPREPKWKILEPGDVEKAMATARRSATTGCRPPRAATRCPTASPTAPRRSVSKWLTTGLKSGDISIPATRSRVVRAPHRFDHLCGD